MNVDKLYRDYNLMDTFLIRFIKLDDELMKKIKLKNKTYRPIYCVYNDKNKNIGMIIFDSSISELWSFIPFESSIINSIEMNQINDFLKWITDLNIKEMC